MFLNTYTVNVTIPRGYKATISVYNLDKDGKQNGDAVETLELGKMMEYKAIGEDGATSGGVVNKKKDSPDSIQLSGTLTLKDVSSNQRVVLEYKEYETFTFSAATWLTTANAGGGVIDGESNRLKDICIDVNGESTSVSTSEAAEVSFEPGETVTWTFKGRTLVDGAYTWLLNYLQINGEYLNVPLLGEHADEEVKTETALSTGTVVTITAENDNPDVAWGKQVKTTTYTVAITNCYEDITISAGNMVGHGHKEFAIESTVGASNVKVYYSGEWKALAKGNREELTNDNHRKNLVFQFQHDPGYHLPEVTVYDIGGNEIENAVTYLKLKDEASLDDIATSGLGLFDEVDYSELDIQSDKTYFFTISKTVLDNIGDYSQLHIYIEGQRMNFEVYYEDGTNDANAPQDEHIANLPKTDNNGGNYYNVVTDNIVSISGSIPTDTSAEYVFAGWQIVAVNNGGNGGVITDQNGEAITLLAGSHLNLTDVLHEWLYKGIVHPETQGAPAYFTLKAVWNEADSTEVINYVVTYNLDGEDIKSNNFTANKGAMLVFNAYMEDGKTFTQDVQNILSGDNHTSTDYTNEGKTSIVLEKVTEGSEEYKAEDLTTGGILINGKSGLTSSTVITVYLQTMIPVNYKFVSGTPDMELPAQVTNQLRTALATTDGVVSEVAYERNGTVSNAISTYSFSSVEVGNGTWRFKKWDKENDTMADRDNAITFTGTWVFIVNTGDLTISKEIILTEGQGTEIDTDKEFTFTITLRGTNGQPLTGTYQYKIGDGDTQELDFNDEGQATLNLKHKESATVTGLPEGAKYTVTEADYTEDGYTTTSMENAEGSITEAGSEVQCTNTYNPSSVVIGNDTNAGITVQKTFTGRQWTEGDEFQFTIRNISAPEGVTAPMPENTTITISAEGAEAGINHGAFGSMAFDTVGTYTYEISETDSGRTGIQYDSHKATVTVEVTDGGNGSLKAEVTYDNTEAETESDKDVKGAAAFTNTYNPEKVVIGGDGDSGIKVQKTLKGRDWC